MQYRDSSKGDVKDLQLTIRELNQQLRDRKQANVVLKAELQRVKQKQAFLEERLAAKEMGVGGVSRRGEAVSIGALRQAALASKGKEATGQKALTEAFDHIDELNAHIDELNGQMEHLNSDLAETRELLHTAKDGNRAAEEKADSWQQAAAALDVQVKELQDQVQAWKQETEQAHKAHSELEARMFQAQDLSSQQGKDSLTREQALLAQLEQVKQEHAQQQQALREEHVKQCAKMEAAQQAALQQAEEKLARAEATAAERFEAEKAAMTQALAAKEANLKGLQQHVAQALDAMSGPPAGFTVVKLTAAAADESVDAIAGAGGATKEGAVVSEGGVHAGVRQHSTLTQGSAVQKAGGRNGEEEQGGADSNCLQIVLHSAALSAQPQPQFGQQHTGTPQLLLLQLSAAGVEQPFRKIVACRGVAAHTGAETVGGTNSGGPRVLLNTVIEVESDLSDSKENEAKENGSKMLGSLRGAEGGAEGEKSERGEKEKSERQARRLLELASGQAHVAVHDMQGALIGGFNCPAPPGHPSGPGQLLPVAVCALQHYPSGRCTLELFECSANSSTSHDNNSGGIHGSGGKSSATGNNSSASTGQEQSSNAANAAHERSSNAVNAAQTQSQHAPTTTAHDNSGLGGGTLQPHAWLCSLSVDWEGVSPVGGQPPTQDEFVVGLSELHPLIMEAARASGLFQINSPFTGRNKNKYQRWSLQPQAARATSTARYFNQQDATVAPLLSPASLPIATATLDLSTALTSLDSSSARTHTLQSTLRGYIKSAGDAHTAQPTATAQAAGHTGSQPHTAAQAGHAASHPHTAAQQTGHTAANTVAADLARAYEPSLNTQELYLCAPPDSSGVVSPITSLTITTRLRHPLLLPPSLAAAAASPPVQNTTSDIIKAPQQQVSVGESLARVMAASPWLEQMLSQAEAGKMMARLCACVHRACVVHMKVVGDSMGDNAWMGADARVKELISDLGPRLSECIASCGHALHRAIQENREDVSLARDMAACVLAHINGCLAQSLLHAHATQVLAHFATTLAPLASSRPLTLLLTPTTNNNTPTILTTITNTPTTNHDSLTALPSPAQQHSLTHTMAALLALQQQLAASAGAHSGAWCTQNSTTTNSANDAAKNGQAYNTTLAPTASSLAALQSAPQQQPNVTTAVSTLLLPPPVFAHAAVDALRQGGGGVQVLALPSSQAAVQGSNSLSGAADDGDQEQTPVPANSLEDACDALVEGVQAAMGTASTTTTALVTELRQALSQPSSAHSQSSSSTQQGVASALAPITAALILRLAQVLPALATKAAAIPSQSPPNSTAPTTEQVGGGVMLARLLVRLQAAQSRLMKGDPWGLPPPLPAGGAGSAQAWVSAVWKVHHQLSAACTYTTGLTALAGGHALLCCGKRHEALRVVLDAGCDDAQRVIGGALIQLKLLSSGQAYGSPELSTHACTDVMATLPQSLSAALLLGLELAVQLILAPVLLRQRLLSSSPSSHTHTQQQQLSSSQPTPASTQTQQPHTNSSPIQSSSNNSKNNSSPPLLWYGTSAASASMRCQEQWPMSLGPLLGYPTQGHDQQGDTHPAQTDQEHSSLLTMVQSARPWSWVHWPRHRVLLVVAPAEQGDGPPQALALAAIQDAANALGWVCIGLEEQLDVIQRQQGAAMMTEREAVMEVAKGVDAAVLLGPAGSIPKWLSQQQVILLPATETDDPSLLRALGAASKAAAKQHTTNNTGANTAAVGEGAQGRVGARPPQNSNHVPGTQLCSEPAAELARVLVARLCVTQMRGLVASVEQQQQRGGGQTEEQAGGDSWHSSLCTLVEDASLSTKADSLVGMSRTLCSKMASQLQELQRGLRASAGHQLQARVSTMLTDATSLLGHRQLLLEGLLLAAKLGTAPPEPASIPPPSQPSQGPASQPLSRPPPSALSLSDRASTRAPSIQGFPIAPVQARGYADSTDSEDEEDGVAKEVQRGYSFDQDSDAASISMRTDSTISAISNVAGTGTYMGGRPAPPSSRR